ncbi:PTS sugar transporter subunit IIA [Suicoccus acidiformans]|nr:PTS glucose transporter subunit IIA [Suicoccus acidiformans]
MNIFKNFFNNIAKKENEDCIVYSPANGDILDLKNVSDEVFASETMGKGIAIIPKEGSVHAPFDGQVMTIFPTGHAIGVKNSMGVELLIHIGINSVELGGEGFKVLVKEGERINQGQKLIEFSISTLIENNLDPTIMIVVTNTDNFSNIKQIDNEQTEIGAELLFLRRRE